MEKKVLVTELVDRGSHLRKEITPTAVVTDKGQYPAGMFWDANKTLNEIVDGATDAQNTLKKIEDKLNQEITDARNAEEAITNRIDDVLGIDAEDIDNLKEVIEDLNSDTGVLSIINNKVDKEDFENLKDSISYELDPTNGYDYVEIGGIKWATKNVGATSETDYGLYFQWGDIQGYTYQQIHDNPNNNVMARSNYKYGNGENTTNLFAVSKYNEQDGKTVLEQSDDPSHIIQQGSWRTPTYEEFVSLMNSTNCTFTEVNNVYGFLCTDKTDDTKTLFFPASGEIGNDAAGSDYIWENTVGCYLWSSSLYDDIDSKRAYGIHFDKEYVDHPGSTTVFPRALIDYRFAGLAIRPVLDENIIPTELGTTISDTERQSWNAKANESDLGGLAFKDEATGQVYANGYNSSSNVTFSTASVDVLTGIFGSREPSFTEGVFNTGTLPSLGSATTSSFATEGVIATVDQPNETVTFTSASTANAVTAQGTFNAGTLPSKAADTFDPGAPGLARSENVISAIFGATAEAQVWTPSAATVTVS